MSLICFSNTIYIYIHVHNGAFGSRPIPVTTIGVLLRKVKTLQQITEKIETEPRPKIAQSLGPRKSRVMKIGLLSPSTRSSRALMEDTKLRKSGPNPFNLLQTHLLFKIMHGLVCQYIFIYAIRPGPC